MVDELKNLESGIIHLQNQITVASETYKGIFRESAEEFTIQLNQYRKNLNAIKKTEKKDEVVTAYLGEIIDSNAAFIELSTLGKELDSERMYELKLQQEGLHISDLSDVVNTYHAQVEKIRDIQKQELRHVSLEFVDANNKIEYRRLCEYIVSSLDRYASNTFDIRITTPANFDPKENNPHHVWGEINVGYFNVVPRLWRVIAHEGPLGHQLHEVLSEKARFKHHCKHTKEGLAILGEYLAMTEFFNDHKYASMNSLLDAQRLLDDSQGAAIEKLFFYDRLPAKKIADQLSSPFMKKNMLIQNLEPNENKREVAFSYGSASYFAGHQKIREIYCKVYMAVNTFSGTKQEMELKQKLLKTIYTGNRSATIMNKEVDAAIIEIS